MEGFEKLHLAKLLCCTMVKVNNPIPSNLKSEAKKAAKILREFTEITTRNGPDKIIPAHVIAKAKGLAILTVIKAGFLVTARGGSGIVLARLPNGRWSAPSAIGIAGLGGGFEIGIEVSPLSTASGIYETVWNGIPVDTRGMPVQVSDLVIILNHERAVEAFAKGGNLTLGGNCTVAIGPLGRNLEGDVALRSSAAVFTYCRSRGLFAGVSLEGSCLIERKETNSKFYGLEVRASAILFGDILPPVQAQDLYDVLESFTLKYETEEGRSYARATKEPKKANGHSSKRRSSWNPGNSAPEVGRTQNGLYPALPTYSSAMGNSWTSPTIVTAVYPFEGQQPGDLTFKVGDKIMVTTKTDSQFDWWEGSLQGRTGIFPANYVTMN